MSIIWLAILYTVYSCEEDEYLNKLGDCIKCDTVLSGCSRCASPEKCDLCHPGYFAYDKVCENCSARCLQCDSTECSYCEEGYSLFEGRCIICNEEGWALLDDTCHPCPASCRKCNTPLTCSECPENAHIKGSKCECDESEGGKFYISNWVKNENRDGLSLTCEPVSCHASCEKCTGPLVKDCIEMRCNDDYKWSEVSQDCVSHCGRFEKSVGRYCIFDFELREKQVFIIPFSILTVISSMMIFAFCRYLRLAEYDLDGVFMLHSIFLSVLTYTANLFILFAFQGRYQQLGSIFFFLDRILLGLAGLFISHLLTKKDDLYRDWLYGSILYSQVAEKAVKMLIIFTVSTFVSFSMLTYDWKSSLVSATFHSRNSMKQVRILGCLMCVFSALFENLYFCYVRYS